MNRTSAILVAALLAISTPFAFAADKPKAPFEVLVSTPEGVPVGDASVEITSAATVPPFAFSGKTDTAGKSSGELVDFEHTYTIKVTKAAYKEFSQEVDFAARKLQKGQLAELKVTLPPLTASDYYAEGAKALQAKDMVRAAAQLELAIATDPKFQKGYSVLALVELEQSHWDRALANADQAIALDATDFSALRSRYEALSGAGDKQRAAAALAELAAKDRSPDVARLLYNAGAQAANTGEAESARLHFREALAIDPSLHQAHSGLAELAIKEKKFAEAVAEFDLALAGAPRNFKALERKIEVLKAMGDKAGAAEAEKALAALKAGG